MRWDDLLKGLILQLRQAAGTSSLDDFIRLESGCAFSGAKQSV